jgi:hypothetical protein
MRARKYTAIVVVVMAICLFTVVILAKAEIPSKYLQSPSSPIPGGILSFLPLLHDVIPTSTFTPSPTLTKSATNTSIPNKTSTPTRTPTRTTTQTSGNLIIADSASVSQFDNIPESAVKNAASIKNLFMHQSTGGLIEYSGLNCLQGTLDLPECHGYTPYYYDYRGWDWKDWSVWGSDLADGPAKTDQWVSIVNAHGQNYDVLGMKFCYTDGWNIDFAYYRDHMLQLEQAYPGKISIWATSALWADPGSACNDIFNSCQNIAEFNNQLRDFARANHKPLYDIADIESDGGTCQVHGYEGMCATNYDSGGGHPNVSGSIKLAKGYWYLMARIAGWNGQ